MRIARICFALMAGPLLRAAGTITATPALPFPGQTVTFMLSTGAEGAGRVRWSFGDGRSSDGGAITTTSYAGPGSYTVRAAYQVFSKGQVSPVQVAQLQIRIADHPGAAFAIAMLRLRWADGSDDAAVPRDSGPLVAFLDLKGEGTGQFQAQWLVDGIPIATITRPMAFAAAATLDSGELPGLPTSEPGEHLVSLRILSPAISFPVPTIRYFVQLERADPPRIELVAPAVLRGGEECDLELTGSGLSADTRFSFGKDIAVVRATRMLGPGRALTRVYVAPTARPGFRPAVARGPGGTGRGPGGLRISPAAKSRSQGKVD
jgi:hypothetical protein